MNFKRISILSLLLIILLATPAFAEDVQLSAEDVYSRALEVLMDMDAIPSFRDKELLMIKSEPLPMKLTTENAITLM